MKNKTIKINTPYTPYLFGGIIMYKLYDMYTKTNNKPKKNIKKPDIKLDFTKK